MTTAKNILFWTGTALATLFFGLLTFVSFNEWWTVSIKKQTSGYPWGPINENPWYYDNPDIYSTVMLTEGIIFTVALTILTTQIIKAKKTGVLYALFVMFWTFDFNDDKRNNKMTAFRILLIIFFLVPTIFVLGYFDFYILTPVLPLPDDICFYHTNTPPNWVRLLYLDSSGHTEPPFSGLHIFTLFAFSLTASIYLAFKTDKWLKNRTQKVDE